MVALHFADVNVLIHDRFNPINRPYSITRKTLPYHNAGASVFDRFFVYIVLHSSFRGRLKKVPGPVPPYNTILLSSVHNIFLHFSIGRLECSLANCMPLAACFIVKSESFRGLQAFKLSSRSRAGMVSTDAAIVKSF